ncbi:condensin-2 complex subunit H2 isoform X11 [Kogia breviceps]
MALVAPDEMEKNGNPLYSCQGEVLASRKDFRMNTCTPHPRGAFMLEPVGVSPTGTLLPWNQKEAGRAEERPVEVSVCRHPVPVPSTSQGPGTTPEGPVPGGGGEEEDTEGAAEPPEASAPEVPMEPQEPRSPEQSEAQPRRCAPREPASRLKVRGGGAWTPAGSVCLRPRCGLSSEQSSSPELDLSPAAPGAPPSLCLWTGGGVHVPHSPVCLCSVLRRPQTPGRAWTPSTPWTLSPSGKVGPTLCPPVWRRLQDRSVRGRLLSSCRTSTSDADHADSRRPRRKGPSFADMEVLYWKHVREQLETLRKLQRREAAERWLPRAQEEPWPAEEDRLEDSLEDLGAAAGDFLEPEEYAEPEGAEPGEDADLEAEAVPASPSYEELVRRNVELFIATSQKFVQETELSQRIRDWEDVIQPLLREQEQHVPFDIHAYGDQVVSRFSQLNQWCPFAELVAGQPAFEVCRSMLASLQLANDYTVEIAQQPGLEAAVGTVSLRLLTYQRAHKRFQTYAAPSMAQP